FVTIKEQVLGYDGKQNGPCGTANAHFGDWGFYDETDPSEGTRRMGHGIRSLSPWYVRGWAPVDASPAVFRLVVVLLGGLPPPPGADAAERSAGLCPLGADLLGSGDGFSDSPARLGAVAALGGARVGRAVLRQRVVCVPAQRAFLHQRPVRHSRLFGRRRGFLCGRGGDVGRHDSLGRGDVCPVLFGERLFCQVGVSGAQERGLVERLKGLPPVAFDLCGPPGTLVCPSL